MHNYGGARLIADLKLQLGARWGALETKMNGDVIAGIKSIVSFRSDHSDFAFSKININNIKNGSCPPQGDK
jgi:hypothetical protein